MKYKTITINHYEGTEKKETKTYKRISKAKATEYFKNGFTVWVLLNSGAYELKPYTIEKPDGDLQAELNGLKTWGTLKNAEYYAIAKDEEVSAPYWIQ